MKQKIAILTDSTSSIYNIKDKKDNIFMINSPCHLGEEVFSDFEKNGDGPFYEALKNTKLIPKTSQPTIGETLEKFEKIESLGYTHVIYLPVSKELSSTYQNGYLAKNLTSGIEITIVDTLTTVSILCDMVIEASRLAIEGLGVDEIVNRILALRANSAFYGAVKDLTALIKNGRLSNAKGFVANLLNIRPVLQLTSEGKLVGLKNVRTFTGALKQVIDIVDEGLNKQTGVLHLLYTNNVDDMEFTLEMLKERFPNNQIKIMTLSSTIVAHVGLEAIVIGYINY